MVLRETAIKGDGSFEHGCVDALAAVQMALQLRKDQTISHDRQVRAVCVRGSFARNKFTNRRQFLEILTMSEYFFGRTALLGCTHMRW